MGIRYGAVALVVRLVYLATGAYFLAGAESRLATAQTLLRLAPEQFSTMATMMYFALWSCVIFGVVSVPTSIGLFRRKEWSRKV